MALKTISSDWHLVPSDTVELEAVRKKCRRLVARRAAISAGMSAVPLPGLDVVTEIGMLTSLIDDINKEFGLTPAQIDRLNPQLRLAAYEVILAMGSVMVGKIVTRALVARLLQKLGVKMLVKHTAKIVPIAGQVVSAALGFAAFRTIGNQHIEACAKVAAQLVNLRPASA